MQRIDGPPVDRFQRTFTTGRKLRERQDRMVLFRQNQREKNIGRTYIELNMESQIENRDELEVVLKNERKEENEMAKNIEKRFDDGVNPRDDK